MFINIHYYLFNYLINKLSDSFENFLLYDFINIINTAFIELNKTLDNTLLTDTTQSISDKLYFQYRDFLNSPLNKKFFIQDTYFIENYIKTLNIQGKITEINSVIRDLYIIGNTTNTITEEDDYIDDANIQTNTNDIYTNLINNETVLAEIDIFNPSNTTEIVPAEIDTITNLDYLDDGSLNLTKNELKDIVVVSLYDFILKEIDILLIKLEPYINDLFTILSQIDKNVPTLIEEFKGYLKILLMHYFTRDETTPTDTAERLLIDLNVFSIKNELYEFYLNYFQSYEGLDSLFTVDNISDATILNIQEDLQKFYFTAVGNRILNSMLAQYSFS
jgi:hypothetical protein